MNSRNTLSSEQEQALVAAMKRAVDEVDAGADVNESLRKQAQEHGWGADMIRFASHAYNTGRQAVQRQQGTTAREKLADFPLADPELIISQIWPETVKSASDISHQTGVSADYSSPPTWLHSQPTEKQAGDGVGAGDALLSRLTPAEPERPRLARSELVNAHAGWQRAKQAYDEAFRLSEHAFDQFVGKLGDLRAYFKQAGCTYSLPAVRDTAIAFLGQPAQQLFDTLNVATTVKQAMAAKPGDRSINRDSEPVRLVEQCIKAACEVNAAKDRLKQARIAMHDYDRQHLSRYTTADEYTPTNPNWLIAEQPQRIEKQSFTASALALGATRAALNPPKSDTQTPAEKTWLSLDDPDHEADLQRIRAQATLAELMDDDVISGYDPEQVTNAYNEIAQTTPRSATNPMIMRTLLRRHLEGNIEPFEASEMTKLDKQLRDTTEGQSSLLRQTPSSMLGWDG